MMLGLLMHPKELGLTGHTVDGLTQLFLEIGFFLLFSFTSKKGDDR